MTNALVPSWLNSLDSLLSRRVRRGNALPMKELLEEIDEWLKAGRSPERWSLNRRSLAAEVEASCRLIGPSTRKAVGQPLRLAKKVMRDLVRQGEPTFADQQLVARVFCDLRLTMTTDITLLAMWGDLLQEIRSEGASDVRAEQLVATLGSCLEMRGVESEVRFSELRRVFGPSPIEPTAWPASAVEDRAVAEAEFLANAKAILLPIPVPKHCVVWLQFEFARLPDFVFQAGDMTFFEAPWALPNARDDEGLPFRFRDELRAVLQNVDDWWTDNGPEHPHSFVVARIDLGYRMTRGAIAAGEEMVNLLLAAATVQTGGIRWRRNGTASLVVDDVGAATQWVAPKTGSTTSYFGMDITTEVLGTTALDLAVTMSTRPLPEEIKQAIRLMSEAGLENSYESAFGVTQSMHMRTAVGHRNHAFEHISAWGGYSEHELEKEITTYWARSSWENEMGSIVNNVIRDRWDQPGVQNLNSVLHPGGYGKPLLFPIAATHQKELIDLLSTRIERERLRWLIEGMRNAAHYLKIAKSYEEEHTIALNRLRRVRNAVVHGNPATPAVVRSVSDVAIRRSNHALSLALEAFNKGISLDELLVAARAEHDSLHSQLNGGKTWLELWQPAAH
jgi:hypothetical protein